MTSLIKTMGASLSPSVLVNDFYQQHLCWVLCQLPWMPHDFDRQQRQCIVDVMLTGICQDDPMAVQLMKHWDTDAMWDEITCLLINSHSIEGALEVYMHLSKLG